MSGLEGSGEKSFRGHGIGLSGTLGQVYWLKGFLDRFVMELFLDKAIYLDMIEHKACQ